MTEPTSEKTPTPEPDPSLAASAGKGASIRRLGLPALAILVVLGGVGGFAYWRHASSRTTTDDAFLTADVVQIAPQVSGTVTAVLVQENQLVHAGDVLARLDDASYKAAVGQAQANLEAAVAQAEGAGISINLTDAAGSAQLTQAEGGVSQAEGSIAGAQADVTRATAGVSKAQSSTEAMTAALTAAQANRERAAAAVTTAEAQVNIASAGARAADAAVRAAEATANKAQKDADRYASLRDQLAVSKQVADQAAAAATVAQAQLESTRQQAAVAAATISARQADVAAAREQLNASEAAIAQAKAQLSASQTDVTQAEAQRLAAKQTVLQAQARRTQALGQLQQAHTKPHQVALSANARAQALAKVEQARAALQAAQLQLQHTQLVAPTDGIITKRTVEVGALVQPGTPLMALVRSDAPWVMANFKETQLEHLHPGEPAEIRVDALGGRRYRAHLDSISPATGATFALLPADNASGNFTKVVQRVPVKLVLDEGQADLSLLRAGMSVTASVVTR